VNIKILDLAERDLIEGYRFYEAQEAGLGSYFLTALYADIESKNLRWHSRKSFQSLLPSAIPPIPFRRLLYV
jgi:hypothetical protein